MEEKPSIQIRVSDASSLRQLEPSEAEDILHAIDNQREYLGQWLPFVPQTHEVSDTDGY